MRKLLVPFDGSDDSVRALRHAIGLAREGGQGRIHLVTATEEPVPCGELAEPSTAGCLAELRKQRCEAILAEGRRLLLDAGVEHDEEILIGPVGETLARRAEELGCDAIVMGTRGMSALGNLVLGSVATQVVHFAEIPVTLVK